jgi:hypothetical protein
MAFEVFDRARPSRAFARTTPTVGTSGNGRLMMFNAAAALMLQDVDHVRLMFDTDARRMAIVPTTKDDPSGFKVNHMPSAANLSCIAFLRHYGIDLGSKWVLTDESGMYCANVNTRARPSDKESETNEHQ